jgi:enamine deaminase RidA (YjgF/YER057c/UK114 family)
MLDPLTKTGVYSAYVPTLRGNRQMNIRHTPGTVAAPFGPYSHAVEVPEGSRLLYISGEVGVLPDGTVPEGIEAQAEACWRNIIAILADAGMGVGNLVKITTYLVRPEDVAAAGAARAKHFGDARLGDNHRQSARCSGMADRNPGSRSGEGLIRR